MIYISTLRYPSVSITLIISCSSVHGRHDSLLITEPSDFYDPITALDTIHSDIPSITVIDYSLHDRTRSYYH